MDRSPAVESASEDQFDAPMLRGSERRRRRDAQAQQGVARLGAPRFVPQRPPYSFFPPADEGLVYPDE
eukprot:5492072-Lingulodinium_polyedra.AAC.1